MTEGTRLSTSTPAARFRAMTRSAEANRLSRRSMMTSFGESGFPVFQAGHWDWQRPHSVQVAMSRSCFHEKSSIRPAPNTTSSSSAMSSIDMSGVEAERAERPRPARRGHVDRGHEDVQVLRVGHEHQKAGDDGDVGQQGHRLDHAVDAGPERCQRLGHQVRGERPPAVGEVSGVDLGAPVQEQGDHHAEDHEQHEPRRAGVGAEEARAPVLPLGGVLDPDGDEHEEGHDDGHGEEVLDEADHRGLADEGDVEIFAGTGTRRPR